MHPSLDWLQAAESQIRRTLETLRPKLLETRGRIAHDEKEDQSAVTKMDLLVEHELQKSLVAFDKGVGFSGEETGADYGQQTFWLVDPIDGTESFMRNMPFATNMVALVSNGVPILSVIYNFGLGEYYLAIKGRGATRNGHPITVSQRPFKRSFLILNQEAASIPGYRAIKVCASGFEYSLIASGAVEGRVSYLGRAKPWDHAAGVLLVQEAGGRVANIGKDHYDIRDTNVVAGSALIFDELKAHADQLLR